MSEALELLCWDGSLEGVFEVYKTTPVWDAESLPKAIQRAHNTRAGVWGRLCVLEGEVVYRELEPVERSVRLRAGESGLIRPERAHEVEVVGKPMRMRVEFMKMRALGG